MPCDRRRSGRRRRPGSKWPRRSMRESERFGNIEARRHRGRHRHGSKRPYQQPFVGTRHDGRRLVRLLCRLLSLHGFVTMCFAGTITNTRRYELRERCLKFRTAKMMMGLFGYFSVLVFLLVQWRMAAVDVIVGKWRKKVEGRGCKTPDSVVTDA